MSCKSISMRRVDEITRDIQARGYTRSRPALDRDIASAIALLSHAAWSLPRDQYYETGERFRTFNQYDVETLQDGASFKLLENAPYTQLKQYNTTLGGVRRQYVPLDAELAMHDGLLKMVTHHLVGLPGVQAGQRFNVNLHVKRFLATPERPCGTSPPGLHKDGEKYLSTFLLGRSGAAGGEVVITNNDRQELDRFVMREPGECYAFDDEAIWHMLTPVCVSQDHQFAYRDIALFDILPAGWEPQ